MHLGLFVGGQCHRLHPLAEKFHAHVQLHRRRARLGEPSGKHLLQSGFHAKGGAVVEGDVCESSKRAWGRKPQDFGRQPRHQVLTENAHEARKGGLR